MKKKLIAIALISLCAGSAMAGIIRNGGGTGPVGPGTPIGPSNPQGPIETGPAVPIGQPCIFYDPANPNTRLPTGCIPKNY